MQQNYLEETSFCTNLQSYPQFGRKSGKIRSFEMLDRALGLSRLTVLRCSKERRIEPL